MDMSSLERSQPDPISKELRAAGEDPQSFLSRVIAEHQLLGLGECHYVRAQRVLLAEVLPDLKKQGVTDLALELPPESQKMLDQYSAPARTSTIDREVLPFFARTDSYLQILRSARDAGLRLHAVDTRSDSANRDRSMANAIENIFDANPTAKVVFLAGWTHVEDNSSSAVSLLSKRGINTFTVDAESSLCNFSLGNHLADFLSAKIVPTSIAPATAALRTMGGSPLKNFDAVAVLPRSTGESLDLAHTGADDSDVYNILFPAVPGYSGLETEAIRKIHILDLHDNPVTDETLPYVSSALPDLQQIDLRGTLTSAQGRAGLKARLPSLTIVESDK